MSEAVGKYPTIIENYDNYKETDRRAAFSIEENALMTFAIVSMCEPNSPRGESS